MAKHDGLLVALGLPKGDGGEEEKEEPLSPEEHHAAQLAAAHEVIRAVQSGSPENLVKAWDTMHGLCANPPPPEEEPEEEDEPEEDDEESAA
jgi:hypothetical protein